MPRKPRVGLCVYCCNSGTVTSDHVPPKCLFPPDARLNLITVNACSDCHDTFKLDDEYFRVTLAVRDDLPQGPASQFLRDQTRKTLRDKNSVGFCTAIGKAAVRVPVYSDDGEHVGERIGLKVNAERVERTAERIIRGLYSKYFLRPLPLSHEVTVSLLDMQQDASALKSPEIQELLALLRDNGNHFLFGDVLNISYAKTEDDDNSSFWWVRLHGAFHFFGFTVPRDA